MKKRTLAISLFCVLLIVFSCVTFSLSESGNISEKSVAEITQRDFVEYAECLIADKINFGDPACTWNADTRIEYSIPLYGPDGLCNGYIFDLSTQGELTGSIQLSYIDGNISLTALSYTEKSLAETSVSDTVRSISVSYDGKLYYFGNFFYAVKSDVSVFTELSTRKTYTLSEATAICEKYETAVVKSQKEGDVSAQYVPITESNYTPVAVDFLTSSDVSTCLVVDIDGYYHSVSNYCAPLSGTNAMLYLKAAGKFTFTPDEYSLFFDFYYAMNTNHINESGAYSETGTGILNIEPGLRDVCEVINVSTSYLGSVNFQNYSPLPYGSEIVGTLKNYLDKGCVLLLTIPDFRTDPLHTVTAYGYNDSYEILYINPSFAEGYYEMNYNAFQVRFMNYIG